LGETTIARNAGQEVTVFHAVALRFQRYKQTFYSRCFAVLTDQDRFFSCGFAVLTDQARFFSCCFADSTEQTRFRLLLCGFNRTNPLSAVALRFFRNKSV
jgi:hypothetical protein